MALIVRPFVMPGYTVSKKWKPGLRVLEIITPNMIASTMHADSDTAIDI